jgi:AraC-like DNA-binding protein
MNNARPNAAHPSTVWQYGRRGDGIEHAIWDGHCSLPLSCHFHAEIQITTVLSGRRRFLTADGPVVIHAGETLIVPPGLPHQALGISTDRTLSLNFYIHGPVAAPQRQAIVIPTPRWLGTDNVTANLELGDWAKCVGVRSGERAFEGVSEAIATVVSGGHVGIGKVASTHGMSREGFIRWFRRHVGMTPHAYRIAGRLNRARALLASGVAPAEAAADAGFADQSHMGRHFRLAFGATPGAYRCAVSI